MNVEDKLSDITSDLVELEENTTFLERLFSMEPGVLAEVISLSTGLKRENNIRKLSKSFKGKLWVTWLDHPTSTYGKGYCTIIFFSEEMPWSSVALYNKQWFSQKLTKDIH